MDSVPSSAPPGHRIPGSLGRITFLGVPVRFHFTFWLAVVWLIWVGAAGAQSGAGSALYVLGLFLSVLFHESGHALSARRFDIATEEIVMLPLGGLSRLARQPSPSEEFWIALSGPLVNLVIGGALLAVTYWRGGAPAIAHWQNATDQNILPRLAVANLTLALFNLMPAFPMDGGRVVRSLLAARRPLDQATRITARIATVLAALIALYGLISSSFLLVFLAFFIYAGAMQESLATSTQELLKGALASDAMLTDFRTLSHGDTIREAAEVLLATSQQDFPVMAGDQVTGLLSRNGLLRAMAAEGPEGYVAGAMEREFPRVCPGADLAQAAASLGGAANCALVFDSDRDDARLIGMLTTENLSEFLVLRKIRATRNNLQAQ